MNHQPSPYDAVNTISAHMATSHANRRTSRSSGSQSGSYPYRVDKPRSNHNSPRVLERRKTTTGTKLYATLDDHYNMMMGITTGDEELVEDQYQHTYTRPMSWHPSSTQFNLQPRNPMHEPNTSQDWSRHYSTSSRNSAHGSDFYSMSARNSTYIEPVQNCSTYTHGFESQRGSHDSDSSWQSQTYAMSSFSTPATEQMPWYLQEWTRKNQEQPNTGSTDFLPIQHPAAEQEPDTADEDMADTGKELIGMGLYDVPDPMLSWGSASVATGKGLKLEETWQPPAEEDGDDEDEDEDNDDDDDDDDDDDASSDDGEEDLPAPPPASREPQQMHAPSNVKSHTQSSMDGQSFFFDEEENISKEWWYQQLKQPSVPVRDAGIGYGWL